MNLIFLVQSSKDEFDLYSNYAKKEIIKADNMEFTYNGKFFNLLSIVLNIYYIQDFFEIAAFYNKIIILTGININFIRQLYAISLHMTSRSCVILLYIKILLYTKTCISHNS